LPRPTPGTPLFPYTSLFRSLESRYSPPPGEERPMDPDLQVDVGPLRLANPLMTASGTCGYGEELLPFTDPGVFGAIVVKSVTLEDRKSTRLNSSHVKISYAV